MKRALRRQGCLLLVVAALMAAAWWQLHSDERTAPSSLLLLNPDTITRVTLAMGDAPAVHYVKHNRHWWRIDQGHAQRADDLRLGELTRIAAAPVRNWAAAKSYDPAKIGLAPPQAKLELDGQSLFFGTATAIGQGVYVQAGERIGIVSLRYMPRSAQSTSIHM